MTHQAELQAFLQEVTDESGVDVSSHLNDLVSHGLTKFLLNDISADDWAEVIKPVGPRILIRRAAGNVYLKAELKNLQTMTEIGRGERDKAITEGSGIRGELEKSQSELDRIENELTRAETELEGASSKSATAEDTVASMEAERAALIDEIDKIQQAVITATVDKEKAVKEKEDAINRAIQFGVSAQATSTGPAGYAFNGLPPSAQSMQPPAPKPFAPQQRQPQAAAAPVQAMPLEQCPWYHGGVSRPDCEGLLMGPTCGPGSFLVRVSTRGDDSYSLSVRETSGARVKHFKIERMGPTWKLALKVPDGMTFPNVQALVANYQSVGDFSGVKLAMPAPKKGAKPPSARSARPQSARSPAAGGAPPKAKGLFCGSCGSPYKPGERFCGSCGAVLG